MYTPHFPWLPRPLFLPPAYSSSTTWAFDTEFYYYVRNCQCLYPVFLFDSLYDTFSHSEIFDFIQIQFLGLSERWIHAHLDEHSVQDSSPLTLGIRGDFLSMYRDYTLNVLYICSKISIFACILQSKEMAISWARLNNFIAELHWGEKFPLTAK